MRAERLIAAAGLLAAAFPACAEDAAADLAVKLSNPVASLVSVPVQNNWDFGIGPADAIRYTANVQPVIPFSLGPDWNLITRTIVPLIHQQSPLPGGSSESGLGDILQSFFFSPTQPVQGWIVGGGPVFLYPTADEDVLGGGQFAAGATFVVLQQQRGWTYGLLANHLWSVAGEDDRADIDASFVQPFLSYTTRTHTTFGFNTEASYDHEASQWLVPLNLSVSQLLKLGRQPIQLAVGVKDYVEGPAAAPDWGLRFTLTLLFPK